MRKKKNGWIEVKPYDRKKEKRNDILTDIFGVIATLLLFLLIYYIQDKYNITLTHGA